MKFLLKLILFISGIIGLSLFNIWATSSFTNLIIFEVIIGIIIVLCLIWIVKIIRDPTLTKDERWNKLFGR